MAAAVVIVLGKHLALKWKKSSLLWLRRLGQKGRGLANGTLGKKKIGSTRLPKFRCGGK